MFREQLPDNSTESLAKKEVKDSYEYVRVGWCRTRKEFYRDLIQESIRFILVGSVPLYLLVIIFAMFFGVVEPVLKYVTPFLATAFALAFARYSVKSKSGKQGNDNEVENE